MAVARHLMARMPRSWGEQGSCFRQGLQKHLRLPPTQK
jgi:hypothetical protein